MGKKTKIKFCDINREMSRSKTPEIFDVLWDVINDDVDDEKKALFGLDDHDILQIQQRSAFYAANLMGYKFIEFDSEDDWIQYLIQNNSGPWCQQKRASGNDVDFSRVDIRSHIRVNLK